MPFALLAVLVLGTGLGIGLGLSEAPLAQSSGAAVLSGPNRFVDRSTESSGRVRFAWGTTPSIIHKGDAFVR